MVQQRVASGAAPRAITRKICVTQAMLDKGFAALEQRRNCDRTVTSSKDSLQEFTLSCTDERPVDGTVHVEAKDAHTVTLTDDLQITAKGGMTTLVHRTTQGRWLGADCGDVKPPE
jgi:hypothetical protein